MITTCKDYITDHNSMVIWDHEHAELMSKCNNCIKLFEEYRNCFTKTKASIEASEDEKQFDFSETYIFGKINSFSTRINKVNARIIEIN